jgi:hypothetical protein
LASTAAAASTLPVPSGATNVDSRELYGGRHKQDAYFLSVPFPDDRAISHYRAILKGWRECPSRAAAWESFGDVSVKPHRFIHQLLWAWVSANNREIAVVAIRYESPGEAHRALPATNQQRVYVVVSRTTDAAAQAEELGYICK